MTTKMKTSNEKEKTEIGLIIIIKITKLKILTRASSRCRRWCYCCCFLFFLLEFSTIWALQSIRVVISFLDIFIHTLTSIFCTHSFTNSYCYHNVAISNEKTKRSHLQVSKCLCLSCRILLEISSTRFSFACLFVFVNEKQKWEEKKGESN